MAPNENQWAAYFDKFEKMQSWIVNDLTRATIRAHTNFLVAMGVFNYIEILGSFCPHKGPTNKDRFNFVFKDRLSPYRRG